MPKSAGNAAAAPSRSRRPASGKAPKTVHQNANPLVAEVKYLSAAALGILLFLSIYTEKAVGVIGNFLKALFVGLFGFGAYLLPFAVLAVAVYALLSHTKQLRSSSLTLAAVLGWCLISLIHISTIKALPEYSSVFAYFQAAYTDGSVKNGGLLGALLGNLFRSMLGSVGAFIVLILGGLITLVFLTGRSFSHVTSFILDGWRDLTEGFFDRLATLHDYDDEEDELDVPVKEVMPRDVPAARTKKPSDLSQTGHQKPALPPIRSVKKKTQPGLWVIEDKDDQEPHKVMLVYEELQTQPPSHPLLKPRVPKVKAAETADAKTLVGEREPRESEPLPLDDFPVDAYEEDITVRGLVEDELPASPPGVDFKNACLPRYRQQPERPRTSYSSRGGGAAPKERFVSQGERFTYAHSSSSVEEDAATEAFHEEDFNSTSLTAEDDFTPDIPPKADFKPASYTAEDDDIPDDFRRTSFKKPSLAAKDDVIPNFPHEEDFKPAPLNAVRDHAKDAFTSSARITAHAIHAEPEFDEYESFEEPVARTPAPRSATITPFPRVSAPKHVPPQRQEAVRMPQAMPRYENYEFPPITLLTKNQMVNTSGSRAQILENSRILEETLKSFRVEAKVIEVSIGPTVTRYDLAPGPGVKVSSIANLSNDLALSLAAQGIRIEAPIPGKAAVGIEIPNKDPQPVLLREIIEDDSFAKYPSRLAFAVGKDIAGSPVITDVARMPHLLIAGATGSGKSVCINTLITSILYKSRPDEVKLLMIDPKVVELSVYNGIPHLLIPVVTDPKKASGALQWAVTEMDNRYGLFADAGVRDLKGYNAYITEDDADENAALPQIVIIIDELADLMMVCKGDVEESICRLAQKARAAGIHLIVATQRPSVDVITGLIKANIPSRLAFAVSSGIDSRTVLDTYGAEKLLGKGDMLFLPMGKNKPIRLQGGFISDGEVEQVVGFLKERTITVYPDDMIEQVTSAGRGAAGEEDLDEFFHEAVEFLIEKGKASTSMLQRQFRIGYNRASRLMDDLEARGIVGSEDGVKPRKIMISREEYYAGE